MSMEQPVHVGVAEQGKLFALSGDTARALYHYREAIRMAVSQGAPEVYFRHYTQCVLEVLERVGSLAEVLEFCERAERHYRQSPPANPLARRDLASIHERKGVILLKLGKTAEAREALIGALALASVDSFDLPLTQVVLQWLRSGLHIDTRRLQLEQERRGYYVVRKGNVSPSLAIRLPDQSNVSTRTQSTRT